MSRRTVLISGAGIAGPALAFWLRAHTHRTGARWGLFFRNQVIKACNIPGLAKAVFGKEMIDKLVLPEYRWLGHP